MLFVGFLNTFHEDADVGGVEMSHFFTVNADHGLIHGGEGFEEASTPVVDMFEGENEF